MTLRTYIRQHHLALVALFVALGGTAYAAVELGKNSVRSRNIAPGQVKRSDLGAKSVNSAKVANGSLRSSDLAAGVIPAEETAPGLLSKLSGVDGAGSGLDADTVDGLESSEFPRVVFRESVRWDPPELAPGACTTTNTQADVPILDTDTLLLGVTDQDATQFQVTGGKQGDTLYAVGCHNGTSPTVDEIEFTLNFMVLR